MGIVLVEGFKYIDPIQLPLGHGSGTPVPTDPVWSRVAGRGGRYGASFSSGYAGDSTNGSVDGVITLPLPGTGQFSLGFASYHPAGSPVADKNCLAFRLYNSSTLISAFSMSTGTLVAADNYNYTGSTAWSILDVGGTVAGWHWWNIVGYVNRSADGYIRCYRDGTLVAEQAPDTAPTGQSANAMELRVGNTDSPTVRYMEVSDLILRNDTTPIPDSRVDYIDLASTASAQWTGSDADQVDNHLLLNGTGPTVDAATYVRAGATGLTDTYTVSALPASGIGAIHAVQVSTVGGSTDSTAFVTRSLNGGNGSASLPVSGAVATDIWETNPSGGAAWDKASVEAATIGIAT